MSTLTFEKRQIPMSHFTAKASVPAVLRDINVQTDKDGSALPPDAGLFIGYGDIPTIFPYRKQNLYNRELTLQTLEIAVLENGFLRAEFLPSLGGRLWSLTDKCRGKNLLYTNDVIRASNLALRDAWFSGGVEWNIGMAGHSPFTCSPLFTARYTSEEGYPVLRMYEYERIRRVAWQMDFYLPDDARELHCHIAIFNDTDQTLPMYWWSNTAVPELPGGRVLTPARSAFTNRENRILQVDIPLADGTDVTYPENLERPVDYFYRLEEERPRFEAYLDADGRGLVQFSTRRLQGRKLFVWGSRTAGRNWQRVLTEQAGPYLEIQAGAARTQYECLPMPPRTVWDWVECYGPLEADPDKIHGDYTAAVQAAEDALLRRGNPMDLEEERLRRNRGDARKQADLIFPGSPYGGLENHMRAQRRQPPLPGHLAFPTDKIPVQWEALLRLGYFPPQDPREAPGPYFEDDGWLKLLEASMTGPNSGSWYARYHLGLLYLHKGRREEGEAQLRESLRLTESPWACHALAAARWEAGDPVGAAAYAHRAAILCPDDLSLIKDCLSLLARSKRYDLTLELLPLFPDAIRQDGRIHLYEAEARLHTGDVPGAQALLLADGGLFPADLREGETTLAELWTSLQQAENRPQASDMPDAFRFW